MSWRTCPFADGPSAVHCGGMSPGIKLEAFAMERLQSTWENRVDWNVSESGVHPLRVEELADDPASVAALMTQALGYPQTNGTVELRSAIAAMYPGATPDHVEVTNGGSEANCLVLTAPRRAGRRSRGDDAELHAGPRPGARPRGNGQELAARRTARGGPPTSTRSRRSWAIARSSSSSATRTTRPGRGWAPPSSMGSAASPTASAPGWCPTRSIEAPSSMASKRRRVWGRSERAHRDERPLEGVRTARPAHRVGRRASARSSTRSGASTTTRRSRRARSTIGWRGMALAPARRAQLLARTRGILRANYPILRRLARRARAAASLTCLPRRAPSPSSAIITPSTRRASSSG